MKWKSFLKKHGLVIGLSVLLAGAITFGVVQTVKRNRTEYYLNNVYQKTFNELVDHINSMNVNLSKMMIASTPRMYMPLIEDICTDVDQTQILLGQLPVSHMVSGDISRFIIQTGDYCNTLSKKIVDGGYMQKTDMDQLESLNKACNDLTVKLIELQKNNNLQFDGLNTDIFFAEAVDNGTNPVYKLQEAQSEYPRLIYDGPFSESVMNTEPKGLIGSDVSLDEAKQKALDFLQLKGQISDAGEENSNMPAYDFNFTGEDGTTLSMAVTKRGGYIIWISVDRKTGSGGIPSEEKAKECAQIAVDYMKQRGLEMQATYAQYYYGEAIINLAGTQNDVILYPDLIKVWVDIQNGKVVAMDARNYLMAHQDRNLQIDKVIQVDKARENVGYALQIDSERLAVIPLDNGSEVLCYEFSGLYDANRFYVYVNAENGKEEEVLKVIDTEDGTLVQ